MNRLAVFGNPIAHSRSPDIHAAFAAQTDIELTYERILVPEGSFVETAKTFFSSGGIGCNITVPCKRDAWEFVDSASDDANVSEAVNTISLDDEGRLKGDNTDGPGLVTDLTDNLGWTLAGKKILVLGAGGAVSGVLANLIKEQPDCVHLHNRTHETAQNLVERFRRFGLTGPEQLSAVSREALLDGYDLVINGTSAALAGQKKIELPSSIIGPSSCCYDMVYGDKALVFLDWARELGAQNLSDGLGMLVEQAALAFQIWFAKDLDTGPDTGPVIDELR